MTTTQKLIILWGKYLFNKVNLCGKIKTIKLSIQKWYYWFHNTDFDKKLIEINKKVTSNKTKHLETEKKLTDHTTSCTKLINDVLEKVELIYTKGL